jgi:integrase
VQSRRWSRSCWECVRRKSSRGWCATLMTTAISFGFPVRRPRRGNGHSACLGELRDHLQRLAANKQPDDLLFGLHWRDWVRKSVKRICAASGVSHVSAHSMRGLHATLAMDAGVTGAVVAASLGQTSAAVTIQSYPASRGVGTEATWRAPSFGRGYRVNAGVP